MNTCPNRFPTIPSNLRMALIGEAPGYDEIAAGQPFVGASGRFLAALLARAGLSRESCFLGNISQYQPPKNDISLFSWTGEQIQDGLYQLKQDIEKFKPNVVVLLGNVPLKAAKDPVRNHPLKPNAYTYKNANWRGSLFMPEETSPFLGTKCLAAYHPAYCLRDYESTPLLQFDLRKGVREAAYPILRLPTRHLLVNLDERGQLQKLQELRTKRKLVALDIEGGIDTMSCISFATSPEHAFIIPINNETTPTIWRALAGVLEDPAVPKVLQNSLYDRFVLHYSYGIRVCGVVDDTMLKHWELYSELEKSLGVQASIYTDECYYKFERKSEDWDTFYKYCCKDSAVTLEISNVLDYQQSTPAAANRTVEELNNLRGHYQLNVAMLNPILYMELRGIRYDSATAESRRAMLRNAMFECQARLNGLTGFGFLWKTKQEVLSRRELLMMRKDGKSPLKAYECSYEQCNLLFKQAAPGLAVIGELEDLCEVSLNVNSNKQIIPYLYETLKLPTQYKIIRGAPEGTTPPTADYEALLKLSRWCIQNERPEALKIVQAIIELRALSTRQQMLSISSDRDGRIRCGYNLVGTNTGRISCYESPTGSGYNLQTIPNYQDKKDAPGGVLGDRDLFIADAGYWLFQCDLAGADGWTVAAYCAMLGDTTMLEDYKAGIKPYAAIALKIAGANVDFRDRAGIKDYIKTHKLGDIEKLMAKRVQHGGAYLEGGLTISRNILKDSEGKVYLAPAECDKLKNWYIRERYWGIPKWHDLVARKIRSRPILTAASGQVRQFFGRPDEILTKAVAFEPQANTTYATNLATYRCWSDNDNRLSMLQTRMECNQSSMAGFGYSLQVKPSPLQMRGCYLRVQPLHTVHDALIGQFPKTDTAWAVGKIQTWFLNPLQIAGQQIIIPFEGGYGPSWGSLNEGKI